MKLSVALPLLVSALRASAIGTLNYTEPKSSISVSGYSDGDCSVGIAIPETLGSDVILNIVGPIKGWSGFDFGTAMANKLLVVAWANGEDVMYSARQATAYSNPPVYSGVKLYPITKGTYVNSTHFSATLLCKGCVTGKSNSLSKTDTAGTFGYAWASQALTDTSSASATLTYHNGGFNAFGMSLSAAKSANYSTWAAMADLSATVGGSNSTSGGTNSTSGSTTVTYSNATYDYIVAGGGAAGLVVAGRLAETGASVLLLERGGPATTGQGSKDALSWNSSITPYDVPGLAYYLSTMDGAAESYCTDTADQAGCILGGSGSVNALMFVPPQDRDFDDKWPAGWHSADISQASSRFFTRNPGSNLPSADGKRYDQAAFTTLSTFLSDSGWTEVEPLKDANAKHNVFAHPPWNIANHMRGGPIRTYLPLVRNRQNFKLMLNTKVVRATRNGTWVSGVETENSDGSHTIYRVKSMSGKVILASGTLSTPRILFYSGIGPTEQIKRVPSSVTLPSSAQWINLPVGQGVKDHTIITLQLGTKTQGSLSALASTAFTSPNTTTEDLWASGSGLLTQSGQRINFWSSVVSPADSNTRFLQGTCYAPSDDTIKIKLYLTHGLTSSANLTLDASSGANTRFEGSPWLQTQGDIEGYHVFLNRFIQMASNSSLNIRLSDGSIAGSNITGTSLYNDIKSTLTTGAHFVGTAKMGTDDGRKSGGSAVVDTNTKVYGTDNLFVVDASIHPDLPTGNTQAIVMVAAEQAVEKILILGGKSIASSESSSTSSNGSTGSYSSGSVGSSSSSGTADGPVGSSGRPSESCRRSN